MSNEKRIDLLKEGDIIVLGNDDVQEVEYVKLRSKTTVYELKLVGVSKVVVFLKGTKVQLLKSRESS